MIKKPDYWYCQAAAAPVRIVDGKPEVLLITSLRSGRWILPKGIIEKGMTAVEAAAQEAWEEAGVTGNVAEHSLGVFEIKKWGGVCSVEVFRMDVTKSVDHWPESDTRKRKWFTIAEAVREVHPPAAGQILKKISPATLRLTLVRHAKSSRDDVTLKDFMRPLNSRGLRDAPVMGRRLHKNGFQPDLIVSSPAARAIKTALLIAKEIDFPGNDIVSMTVIYDAEVNNLLEVVRGLPEASRDVMLVGHNPGLTDLANLFARTGINNIPTCGLLQLEFNAQHWRDILPGSAAVVLYDYPRRDMCSL